MLLTYEEYPPPFCLKLVLTRSRLSLTFPPVTVVDPALRDDVHTHLPRTTTTAVALLVAIVLAATDMATVTEARDETTMTTELAIDHHPADQWRTILLPLLAVATMTRTDATTLLLRTPMPMVDRRTTGLPETSLPERVDTPGRDIPATTIVVDATGKSISYNRFSRSIGGTVLDRRY